MRMLDAERLDEILERLPTLKIAVVGDLFLDKYLELDANLTEISVETGLEAYQVAGVRRYPGAGGTVLNNLRALGVGELHAISVVGVDGEGFELLRELARIGVRTEAVLEVAERMTPTYTKPMLSQAAGPARELNRLDVKNRSAQGTEIDCAIMAALDELAPQMDAVIVADQVSERNCGVITDAVRDHLAGLAEDEPTRFFSDSRSHIGMFRNCAVKPNRHELSGALGTSEDSLASIAQLTEGARALCRRVGGPVFATCGPDGIVYVDAEQEVRVPGIRVEGPIDIVGAGDSTTAGIVSGLCCGATPAQAAQLGCLVASITIQKLGVTGTASPEQIREQFRRHF